MQEQLIEGINIISKEPICKIPIYTFGIAFASLVLMFIFLFASNIVSTIVNSDVLPRVFRAGALLAGLVFVFFLGKITFGRGEETGRYTYQATIDENVSLVEFYEHYEIIEQNEGIWIIQDKED